MTAPAVSALTCNHAVDPLGVETPAPRLAWQLDPGRPGLRQTAWQVQAASTRERLEAGAPDLWDSGRVAGDRQFDVPYGGLPLGARRRAAWRVRAWDDQDAASAWSAPAAWEMGLLRSDDWVAQWIGADRGQPQKPDPEPAPLLRRACTLPGGAVRARAYVCGLGLGVFTVNGARPDDRVLAPAATTYDRAVLYETFDITPLLRDGENVFGLVLGNGWYNCHTREVWDFVSAPWRDQPKGLVQIHIEHADGGQTCIASGPDWRVHPGPVVFDGLRNGETFDARRALPGWDAPGFDDGAWTPAKVLRAPGGVLRSAQLPPMRVVETVAPAAETPRGPGVRVVDFGRNLTGWTRLTARGPAGAEVVLRHAEKRTPDGDIDQGNINSFIKSGETQTDRCLLAGAGEETAGEETWEPGFAYHGFQYVEVTAPETVDLRVEARVVHTDLPSRGGFRCSSDHRNTVQELARRSTLENFHGLPTDCPHREKNGWTGDAALSAEEMLYNFDARTAYRKWLADLRDVQRPSGQFPGIVPTGGWGYNWGSGPAWDSAAFVIPWALYVYDGETAVLEEHYPAMARYLPYARSQAVDGVQAFGLGDWCPPSPDGNPNAHNCPAAVTDTAYFVLHCRIAAATADRLGRTADAARFRAWAAETRAAWRRAFLDPATGRVADGGQTAQACALYQDLLEPDEVPLAVARLVEAVEATDRHIDCGILGNKYLFRALADHGHADLACAIATQPDYPGFGHWIAQGATTLWESWEGGSSRNHHMFADISAWFFSHLAGLRPDPAAPGFRRVRIRPHPVAGLDWAEAWHDAPAGRVSVAWRRADGRITLESTLPPNTTGVVEVPAPADAIRIETPGDAAPSGPADGPAADPRTAVPVASGPCRISWLA